MTTDKSQWVPEREGSVSTKLLQKACAAPFVPVGTGAFAVVTAYGLHRLKARGRMKMSVHLIHTRMAAQACLVGALMLGASYSLYKDYVRKPAAERAQK